MDTHASLTSYLLVTGALGGGTAWLTGRAVARTWRTLAQLALYVVLLAAVSRFLHYALFHGALLSLNGYLIDLATLGAIALLGFRVTRTNQMVTQYDWLYERNGPFSWRSRAGAEGVGEGS
ncbi:MAG: DUF6867 family protein [Pseudomonadota bacterium]